MVSCYVRIRAACAAILSVIRPEAELPVVAHRTINHMLSELAVAG